MAPGVSESSVKSDITRLTRIVPALRRLSGKLGKMLFWTYVSTESGIHISYPGHGGYPENYDPRKRPWYTGATMIPHWFLKLNSLTKDSIVSPAGPDQTCQ